MTDWKQPVVVEQNFQVPKSFVWRAITDPKQMRLWYFEQIRSFVPVVGFSTRFEVENEGRVFPHLWTITHVEPMKTLTYRWQYEGYPGDSYVTFQLCEMQEVTRLTLTHRVVKPFPAEIPEFTRASCLGGWQYFLNQQLKAWLAKLHP